MHYSLKNSGSFQQKEYKLRLVRLDQAEMESGQVVVTFTLDSSLYADRAGGPGDVEQRVDLYASELMGGVSGPATVHLRVRC
ncbi:unnamed protein product, partial [Discosporangium mesarthrocarpum]